MYAEKNRDIKSGLINRCVVASFMLFVLFSGCRNGEGVYKETFFGLGTFTTIKVYTHRDTAQRAFAAVDSIISDWDVRFSQEGAGSDIQRLNSGLHQGVEVSDELFSMIKKGCGYGDTTSGYFDITLYNIKKLWGFPLGGEAEPEVPDTAEIESMLKNTGYKRISIKESINRVASEYKGMRLDLGGIAKSCVINEIDSTLISMGLNTYLIESGGDIFTRGDKPDKAPWVIGIQNPRGKGLIASVEIDNGGVVTSGDYQRFWMRNGMRYHHLLNPETGRPARENISLSIFSEDPVRADILSTGLFPMKADSITDFVNTRDDLECLVVDAGGEITVSQGWKEFVKTRVLEN
ncbi:MAG: FAD:protein FMN transferase [Chitinivibrionales bacterium]